MNWFLFYTIGFLIIILIKIYSTKIIGWFGELWTKQELKKLPSNTYKILNNIMISTNDILHQIDHIIVSKYGIFVIETKQYNGYITGNKYDKKWIRHSHKRKYYYTNPIRQNYGHVKAICELLDFDETKVFNVVCIPSRAILRVKHDGELVRNTNICEKIISYKTEIISDVDDITRKIITSNITNKKLIKLHNKEVRKKAAFDSKTQCPKCGSNLITRESKYGKFLGCSNFPDCTYKKQL